MLGVSPLTNFNARKEAILKKIEAATGKTIPCDNSITEEGTYTPETTVDDDADGEILESNAF